MFDGNAHIFFTKEKTDRKIVLFKCIVMRKAPILPNFLSRVVRPDNDLLIALKETKEQFSFFFLYYSL